MPARATAGGSEALHRTATRWISEQVAAKAEQPLPKRNGGLAPPDGALYHRARREICTTAIRDGRAARRKGILPRHRLLSAYARAAPKLSQQARPPAEQPRTIGPNCLRVPKPCSPQTMPSHGPAGLKPRARHCRHQAGSLELRRGGASFAEKLCCPPPSFLLSFFYFLRCPFPGVSD